ncbi:MAG: PIG-L deacetylase family protein [Victivallaceae bacterium]
MNILVFCAHADDEVIGMGGTIRKLADAGANIRLVMFSEGAEGYPRIEDKNTIVEQRQRETEAVCQILGIQEYINLHGLDWSLQVNNETYRQVIHHIREFRPDAVFTHAETDYKDHMAVSQVSREGWFHAALACAMEDEPEWKLVPLYEFEVIRPINEPDLIVDITDTFPVKKQAMEVYNSQTGIVGNIFQLLEGRALQRGYLAGVKHGEAFTRSNYRPRLIREVETLLERE